MLAPQSADQAQAMLAALQGQQAQQQAQRDALSASLAKQGQQAGSMRALALLTSMGQNPLLQGLNRTAEAQAINLDNLAARTEGRLSQAKAGMLDPTRIIALQQAAQRLKQQQDEAEARAKAEAQRLALGNRRVGVAEAKAAQGPKSAKAPTLPASEVAAIADIGVATTALDDLVAAHGRTTTGLMGGALGHIPNTDASEFNDKVKATAQVVGTILEHGKMTDGDIPKYAAMLPKITDSPERAAAKRDNVKALLLQQASARKKTFGQAGYNVQGIDVPTIDLTKPPPAAPAKAPPKPAAPGVVGPGDPRNVTKTITKNGKTFHVFADGHVEVDD